MKAGLSSELLLKAAQLHNTPLYVYDQQCIQSQYQQLQTAFAAFQPSLFYACKALSNVNILRIMHQLGAGIDCVSLNEVRLSMTAGVPADKIIFTPNSVGMDEYVEAVALGVNINIDNLSILRDFGKRFGKTYPVLVRINPHILAGGNIKISTGHEDSKFGISVTQVDAIKAVVAETGLIVKGLHIHTGSEIKDIDVYIKGLELVLATAQQFDGLEIIDLGGGFKVPYVPGEKGTDLLALGERMASVFNQHKQATGANYTIWFEPGKFLVSDCGYLLVKANVIKEAPSRTFVGVDSGFNHLIRPMFYEAYHHIENISNPQGINKTYNVVGNICETDTFAWDRSLPEVRPGDVLVFRNAGAYGFEMSSRFNSRVRPAEVLIDNKEIKLIRRRETFEDLLQGQII